jgi:parvulin-like peptidyl-prolyl isomerase
VAFDLSEGEISQPILSRFGYHIIRLNWRRGEKINTSHILVNLRPTDQDAANALEHARQLKAELDAGAEFAELAAEESDDSTTATDGGDLGWFDKQQLRPEYAAVATELEIGDVSDPVQTTLGIHLLKLTDYQAPRPMDLKKDWDRISRLARVEKQEIEFARWMEDLRQDVYIEVFNE